MESKRIGIVGLGLIGGSFAKAYRAADAPFTARTQTPPSFPPPSHRARWTARLTGRRSHRSTCSCWRSTRASAPNGCARMPRPPAAPGQSSWTAAASKRRVRCGRGARGEIRIHVCRRASHGRHRALWASRTSRADLFRGASILIVPGAAGRSRCRRCRISSASSASAGSYARMQKRTTP